MEYEKMPFLMARFDKINFYERLKTFSNYPKKYCKRTKGMDKRRHNIEQIVNAIDRHYSFCIAKSGI